MKKIIYSIICFAFIVCQSSCMYKDWNDKNISISVKERASEYQFTANYAKYKTVEVRDYINRCISPSSLFASNSDYFDANTKLEDGTKFYIKSYPGKLKIKFDKRINSKASYRRIRNMCEGLKDVLAQRQNQD